MFEFLTEADLDNMSLEEIMDRAKTAIQKYDGEQLTLITYEGLGLTADAVVTNSLNDVGKRIILENLAKGIVEVAFTRKAECWNDSATQPGSVEGVGGNT